MGFPSPGLNVGLRGARKGGEGRGGGGHGLLTILVHAPFLPGVDGGERPWRIPDASSRPFLGPNSPS